jgi:hypothetical protein
VEEATHALEQEAPGTQEAPMRLVRRGTAVRPNGRAQDLADRTRETLAPILGDKLAQDVANNSAAAFGDDDEIYQPDMPFSEMVRAALVQRMRHPKVYRAEHLTPEMVDRAVEAVTSITEETRTWHGPVDEAVEEEREVKPNARRSSRRASTLGGRAAMDTRGVGRDVDPDRYNGKRGKDLDAAMNRYETFHAKRPMRVVDLGHELPTSVVCVGQVISTMYRTDKWHKDGDDEDYKHVHDNSRGGKEREYEFGKGVLAYEPAREASRSRIESGSKRSKPAKTEKPVPFPVGVPSALTLLGYCLGVFVHRFDDDQIYEINPRGCYLFCSPKGDMLALYSPNAQPDGSRGFLMIMAGGGLRVLKDGIDG